MNEIPRGVIYDEIVHDKDLAYIPTSEWHDMGVSRSEQTGIQDQLPPEIGVNVLYKAM